MLTPVLGALTAIWLLISPLIDLETGVRATLAVSVGLTALLLAPLGIWFPPARWVTALLGAALALVNFADPTSFGPLANFATCSIGLVLAGVASGPRIELGGRRLEAATPGAVTAAAEVRAARADARVDVRLGHVSRAA